MKSVRMRQMLALVLAAIGALGTVLPACCDDRQRSL